MSLMFKFACVPSKFAPKRKMVDFALPKWRNKLGEFTDPDLLSWINNLYQERTFKTAKDFNQAYDERDPKLNWSNRPMIISKENVEELNEQLNEGSFDDGQKAQIGKLIGRMLTVLQAEKVIFVY